MTEIGQVLSPDSAATVSGAKVTVVVPVLNGESFIRRCIDSLLAQDYADVEVVIVDDGSTDRTCELIPPAVKLVRTKGRTGAGAARNLGARNATGHILMFTDSDCVVPPTWVSRAVETMRRNGVRCGGGGYAGPVREVFVQQFAYEELAWRRRHIAGYVQTLVSNNMHCEDDLFWSAGGFPEAYRAASSEDMEFSWNVSRRERLWWDPDNGVFHDFASTVSGYLRQQMRFARDAVPMMLGQTSLIGGKTHHGKQLYIETALAGLLLISLVTGNLRIAIAALAAVLMINVPFLFWVSNRRAPMFGVKAAGMVFLRNVTIVWGCVVGLYGVIMMRIHRK